MATPKGCSLGKVTARPAERRHPLPQAHEGETSVTMKANGGFTGQNAEDNVSNAEARKKAWHRPSFQTYNARDARYGQSGENDGGDSNTPFGS
ncbi:MAG TPA: hypothetical protein VK196_19560 [Magnetospirillum sp.]|nr:hypothetical protein [Magnetospirillum sp.]